MQQSNNTPIRPINERLADLCRGLFYVSETDAAVLPFIANGLETMKPKEVGEYFELPKTLKIETGKVEDFFSRVTLEKEWFTKEQRDAAKKFQKIEAIFANELNETGMIRFGLIRIEILLVGFDSDRNIVGIRTKAVET